jgi:Right handed beta helix region
MRCSPDVAPLWRITALIICVAYGRPAPAATKPSFRTSEHIEAASYLVTGDGKTDNTQTFLKLLARGDRTIHVAAGDYVTGKLTIPSKTILMLDQGVTLRDSGKLGVNDCLITIASSDVYIAGRGARVIAKRRDYTSGEQRHGVFIYGASNVVIEGLESSGHGGDGFYIGGPPGHPATNITLSGCVASNNRRQGASITSARHVDIIDCRFDHTIGTSPQYGMDLEPNDPGDVLDHIRIIRPYTEANRGGGILVVLQSLNASSERVTITVSDHKSVNESPSFSKIRTDTAPASIEYSAAH